MANMSKFTMGGLLSFLGGLLLLGFQAISTLMDMEGVWKSLSLVDIFDEAHFLWIDGISWGIVRASADYVVTMPLFVLLFCLGVLFFMISVLLGR